MEISQITRRLMAEHGLQRLVELGYTPTHVKRMRDSWKDERGNPRRGVSPIELDRVETPETIAVLVFRPENMTIGFDLQDRPART